MLLADQSTKSPVKKVNRVKLEVESVTNQSLPNGQIVGPGKSEIIVYSDEVEQVMGLLRNDDERASVARAEKEFEARLTRFAKEKCGGNISKARESFGESVESVFCQQNSGTMHIKPLLSVRTIEKDIPPPADVEKIDAQKQTVDALAGAISKLFSDKSILDTVVDLVAKRISQTPSRK